MKSSYEELLRENRRLRKESQKLRAQLEKTQVQLKEAQAKIAALEIELRRGPTPSGSLLSG